MQRVLVFSGTGRNCPTEHNTTFKPVASQTPCAVAVVPRPHIVSRRKWFKYSEFAALCTVATAFESHQNRDERLFCGPARILKNLRCLINTIQTTTPLPLALALSPVSMDAPYSSSGSHVLERFIDTVFAANSAHCGRAAITHQYTHMCMGLLIRGTKTDCGFVFFASTDFRDGFLNVGQFGKEAVGIYKINWERRCAIIFLIISISWHILSGVG